MVEEVINIRIEDAELDAVLLKLGKARTLSRSVGRTRILGEPLSSGRILNMLPSVTRAQRLIITQIPLMREALMLTYRARMISEAGGVVATGVIIIYILTLLKQVERIQKQMIRDMESFESEVREGLDLTHREFDELGREIIGFATPWEQLQAELREAKVEGYLEGRWLSWDAITDYVRTRIGTLEPTVGYQPAANVPPQSTPYAPWLQGLIDWYTQVTDEIKEKLGSDSGVIYNGNLDAGLTE